ncbi:hydrolase [Glaciihabitans arcticus]|uniref:Hydrolase n=1 Tax=Glaciihabitans arcticus TaxID=2668039 RepID=A0A4Q9GVU7_9MICO|nr:HAD-IA family hydrolase [Glaciihabitans arcticus]TBN56310.1 hydrolase [Glaciihabitans arcticus]
MTLLFIFDMDDVLYDYDWRTRMTGMTAMTGLSLDQLRQRWWHDKGEWAAEAGVYRTGEEYLEAVETALGQPIDEHEWVRVRAAAMTARPEALAAVRRASELGQVTLLTNNGALAHKHLRTLAPELVELFGDEHLFTSSYYGARKPNPAVFQSVLDAYGVDADDAFFADDMTVNVEGARSIGITAYHYGSAAGMLAAIESFAATRARV